MDAEGDAVKRLDLFLREHFIIKNLSASEERGVRPAVRFFHSALDSKPELSSFLFCGFDIEKGKTRFGQCKT